MSLGILRPTSTVLCQFSAELAYAGPDWWGYETTDGRGRYQWQYHPHLGAAAKVLQRRWRVCMGLRRAEERLHWSEVSRGHLRWCKSAYGGKRSEDKVERPNARAGKWDFAQVFSASTARHRSERDKADKRLLAAAYDGNEPLVRHLLDLSCANLDCVDAYPSLRTNAEIWHMPLDVAVRQGHGEIACWILEKAGSGTMLRGMHPECVPSACGPRGLLTLCNEGAKKLFTEWNKPTLNVRYQQVRQRRALAKAVHTLLQSSHVAGDTVKQKGYPHMARFDEDGRVMFRHWLVDARMPGALMRDDPQGWVYADRLLKLAWWAEHTDLAARLYLAGVRCTYNYKNGVRIWVTQEHVVRFVARAVVRTLLRRHVKMHLIAWYWAEAAAKAKYAAPDAAGFEDAMAAPVFREGALGA